MKYCDYLFNNTVIHFSYITAYVTTYNGAPEGRAPYASIASSLEDISSVPPSLHGDITLGSSQPSPSNLTPDLSNVTPQFTNPRSATSEQETKENEKSVLSILPETPH